MKNFVGSSLRHPIQTTQSTRKSEPGGGLYQCTLYSWTVTDQTCRPLQHALRQPFHLVLKSESPQAQGVRVVHLEMPPSGTMPSNARNSSRLLNLAFQKLQAELSAAQ